MDLDLLELINKIGALLLLALALWFIYRIGKVLISKGGTVVTLSEGARLRAKTARSLALSAWKYVVVIFFLIGLLTVTGAGATMGAVLAASAALIVAFGAQSVIKDVFAGFSVMIEGQYTVGDRVMLLGPEVEGLVEGIGLRVTVIREADGSRVFVPNGSVDAVRNLAESSSQSSASSLGTARPTTRRPRRATTPATRPSTRNATTPATRPPATRNASTPSEQPLTDGEHSTEAATEAAAQRRRRRRGGRGRGGSPTTTDAQGNARESSDASESREGQTLQGQPPPSQSTRTEPPQSETPQAQPPQSEAPQSAAPQSVAPQAPQPQSQPSQPPAPQARPPQSRPPQSNQSDGTPAARENQERPPRETPWSIE